MFNAFTAGGWGMYPTLVFGLMLVAVSLRYAIRPERRWIPLMTSLGLLTLFAGGLGFTTGVIAALTMVTPDTTVMALYGLGEALNNFALAFLLLVMGAIAAALGSLRLAHQHAVS